MRKSFFVEQTGGDFILELKSKSDAFVNKWTKSDDFVSVTCGPNMIGSY